MLLQAGGLSLLAPYCTQYTGWLIFVILPAYMILLQTLQAMRRS